MKRLLPAIFLFCILQLVPVSQVAHATGQTVRVAFLPEMYGFYEIQENGDFSGYNYDYLMTIAQHTNWNYEFVVIEEGGVSASLAKAEDMLYAGELDLVGPFSAASVRYDDFEIGQRNYGVYRYNFYSARNNYAISQDNYFLKDTLKVALVEYYYDLNEMFLQQMSDKNFELDITYVQNHGDMVDLLLSEQVDAIINLDMSATAEYLDYLTTIDRIPFYFASTKGNTELVAELDEAIRKVDVIDLDLHQKLLDTYFGVRYGGEFLYIDYEKELLAEIETFHVGFLRDVPPYQYINEEGENAGISIEIVKKIEETIGIPFEIHWYDSLQEISYALESKEVDFVGTLSNNMKLAHSLDVTLTNPYISSGIYWLRSVNEVENPSLMFHYVSDGIPFYNSEDVAMVWDIEKALDHMDSTGELSIFCDPQITNYYFSLNQYKNIEVKAVSNVLSELTFGAGDHIDENLIGMLNRAILFLDPYEVDEIIFNNTSVSREISFADFFREHSYEIFVVASIVVVIMLVSIYNTLRKFRELSRRDGLTNLFNSGYFHDYVGEKVKKVTCGGLILIDIDYFKAVNDNHGHHVGDEIIKQVAKHLETYFDVHCFHARVGGDEFAIFIDGKVEKSFLEERAARLLQGLLQNETGVAVTLSIGGFLFENATDYTSLYKSADIVLYKVKERGRNGFLFVQSVEELAEQLPVNLLEYEFFVEKANHIINYPDSDKTHGLLSIELEGFEKDSPLFGEVITRIIAQVRSVDFVTRIGERGFLLFLESCGSEKQVGECQRRIESELEKSYEGHSGQVKVEVQVAIFPDHGKDFESLVAKFDHLNEIGTV
ncbi:MAG: GGDEF domain-containing protein [Eubacteriales bacterium]